MMRPLTRCRSLHRIKVTPLVLLVVIACFARESQSLSSSSSTLRQTNAPASRNNNNYGDVPTVVTSTNESFPSSFVKLMGVDHHIRDTGDPFPDAPVAILLHGLAGSTESWEDVAPLLYEQGIRAVAIDRVGFGRTERPKQVDALPSPLRPPDDKNPWVSLVKNPLADFIESSSLMPPHPPNGLVPEPLREALGQVSDILPPPNKALATAIRRPSLLAPKLPWSASPQQENPYSSEFAAQTLGALVRDRLGLPHQGNASRKLYLVGHSAGGPIALKAYLDATDPKTPKNNYEVSGVALVAPAVLDPAEDPGIYDAETNDEDNRSDASRDNNLRLRVFRSVLALPDALVVPIVRRIYDGRNLTEAVLNQTSSAELSIQRVNYLAEKYKRPVEEFPDDWDVALLNVYRADFRNENDNHRLRGRKLIQQVVQTAEMLATKEPRNQPTFCVISGDDDPVVPARASKRVVSLLNSDGKTSTALAPCKYVELPCTGHLPMDENPQEMARVLLDFIQEK